MKYGHRVNTDTFFFPFSVRINGVSCTLHTLCLAALTPSGAFHSTSNSGHLDWKSNRTDQFSSVWLEYLWHWTFENGGPFWPVLPVRAKWPFHSGIIVVPSTALPSLASATGMYPLSTFYFRNFEPEFLLRKCPLSPKLTLITTGFSTFPSEWIVAHRKPYAVRLSYWDLLFLVKCRILALFVLQSNVSNCHDRGLKDL